MSITLTPTCRKWKWKWKWICCCSNIHVHITFHEPSSMYCWIDWLVDVDWYNNINSIRHMRSLFYLNTSFDSLVIEFNHPHIMRSSQSEWASSLQRYLLLAPRLSVSASLRQRHIEQVHYKAFQLPDFIYINKAILQELY
jgi:hypothetical protein